jgi:hypothetical protein
MKLATSRRLRRATRTAVHWCALPMSLLVAAVEQLVEIVRELRERGTTRGEKAQVLARRLEGAFGCDSRLGSRMALHSESVPLPRELLNSKRREIS